MHASDFDASLSAFPVPVWNNRMSFGPVSYTNGDFVSTTNIPANWPTSTTVGTNNVAAVWFDGTATSTPVRMQSSAAWYPSNSIFATNDWSLEAWVYTNGWESSTFETPFFQWGPRGGTTPNCASAGFGLGSSTSWGAASFWNCDVSYAAQASPIGAVVQGAQGLRPAAYRWQHYVATFQAAAASLPAS